MSTNNFIPIPFQGEECPVQDTATPPPFPSPSSAEYVLAPRFSTPSSSSMQSSLSTLPSPSSSFGMITPRPLLPKLQARKVSSPPAWCERDISSCEWNESILQRQTVTSYASVEKILLPTLQDDDDRRCITSNSHNHNKRTIMDLPSCNLIAPRPKKRKGTLHEPLQWFHHF